MSGRVRGNFGEIFIYRQRGERGKEGRGEVNLQLWAEVFRVSGVVLFLEGRKRDNE